MISERFFIDEPQKKEDDIYYLLTEFAFRTVDQGPEVRTELARSVRKDRGLNILQYEKQTG